MTMSLVADRRFVVIIVASFMCKTSVGQQATADAGVTRMTPVSATDPVISVVVSTARDLDDAAAARLLRWCEAQLHLLDTGRSVIDPVRAENPVTISEQHVPGSRPRQYRPDESQHDRALWPSDSST